MVGMGTREGSVGGTLWHSLKSTLCAFGVGTDRHVLKGQVKERPLWILASCLSLYKGKT